MGWRRNSLSNEQAVDALAGSGNSFTDAEILGRVPWWRRGVVQRQANAARISGTPTLATDDRVPQYATAADPEPVGAVYAWPETDLDEPDDGGWPREVA